MANIASILGWIKQNPSRIVDYLPIRQVCMELGLDWRERCLDPATTAALFIKQIIHGNSACTQVRHLSDRTFSAQAYCKARMRLSLVVLQTLSRRLCDTVRRRRRARRPDLFLGHRVFLVDGSTFSMPDTAPLQAEFGQPGMQKAACGFLAAHLLAMFDLNSGMLIEAVASPLRTHDLAKMSRMHPHLRPGDLLLGDTAFGSYTHFALLLQAKVHGLMPNHQQRIVDFTPHRRYVGPGEKVRKGLPRSRWIKSLGLDDQLVEWFKPSRRPRYMSLEPYHALPASITVREIRRWVRHPGLGYWVELTIVTTLLDEKTYPAQKLVELRLRRWQAEVNLRHLKTTMGLEVLKCQTVDGVRKELAAFVLVYNLMRLLMLEAAQRQKTRPDRISFAGVLAWVRVARPNQAMPRFVINPMRPQRIDPRAIKRRPKPFDLMNQPRYKMRETLRKQAYAA
jgi:hypothetical protein